MTKRYPRIILMLSMLIAVVLLSQVAVAQNHWLRPVDETSFSLDIFKPKFDRDYGFEFFSSVMFFSGYLPATDNLAVVFEFPIANADTESFGETQFGNPYIGAEYKIPNMEGTQAFVHR